MLGQQRARKHAQKNRRVRKKRRLSSRPADLHRVTERASIYKPLSLHRRQIRLLRLLPGRRNDDIRCTLYTAYLDDDPCFEALSYVWGDPETCLPISVDGRKVEVTINLEMALRRLRHRRGDRSIWVDALCINQLDRIEKSHQVNLMKDVYSSTTETILWLGDYSEAIPSSSYRNKRHNTRFTRRPPLANKPRLLNPSATLTRRTVAMAFDVLKRMASNKHYDTVPHEDTSQALDQGPLDALDRLMKLPWWQRIWTAQESILPSRAVLKCGSMQFAISKLVTGYWNSRVHYYRQCCAGRNFLRTFWARTHSMLLMRDTDPGTDRFLVALNLFRYRKASDPRDKVFALLGFGATMSADYSLSPAQAFALSLRSSIDASGLLLALVRTREVDRTLDLPTWVPDWCAVQDESDGFDDELAWLYQYVYYDAARKTHAKTRSSNSQSILDLQGARVDNIREVGWCFDVWDTCFEVRAQWQDMSDRARELNKNAYPCGGTYDEAFWRTMTVDIVYERREDKTVMYRRAVTSDESICRQRWATNVGGDRLGPQCKRRRFFVTEKGMIGFGTRDIKVHDTICVLQGGNMPFVLRPNATAQYDSCSFGYVGQAYVHGIMDGEVMREGCGLEWISLH